MSSCACTNHAPTGGAPRDHSAATGSVPTYASVVAGLGGDGVGGGTAAGRGGALADGAAFEGGEECRGKEEEEEEEEWVEVCGSKRLTADGSQGLVAIGSPEHEQTGEGLQQQDLALATEGSETGSGSTIGGMEEEGQRAALERPGCVTGWHCAAPRCCRTTASNRAAAL